LIKSPDHKKGKSFLSKLELQSAVVAQKTT
jgi:hypothetical protein